METNDNASIIRYGERSCCASLRPIRTNSCQMLDRVTRALVEEKNARPAKRAIAYAERYQADVAADAQRKWNRRDT